MIRVSLRKVRWALVMGLIGVLGAAWLIGRTDSQGLALADFEAIPRAVPMDPVSLNLALDDALAGTLHYRNWELNATPQRTKLTIYVFDSGDEALRATRIASMFRHNAAFIADMNVIAIDYQLVFKLWQRYFASDQSWGSRAGIVGWIVGHEVGHLVNGDHTSHFRSGSMLQWAPCTGTPEEIAADAYYANLVTSWDKASLQSQVRLFSEIVHYELTASTKNASGLLGSLAGRVAATFNKCTHPEYVMRAYRFIDVVATRTKDPLLRSLARSFRDRLDLPK